MNSIQICEPSQALVIQGPGHVGLADRAVSFASSDLLIEPLVVGICATDRELIDGSMVYLRSGQTKLPLTPGHEWVGRVVAVGDEIDGFQVGDIVVGECSIGCGTCATCLLGSYHRCANRVETGVMGLDGALARQLSFPARAAHRVPQGVNLEDAAMVEPLAVAVRAVQRLDVSPGDQVLIVGAGVVGLLAAMVLVATHECDVHVAEPDPSRRTRAQQLGAHTSIPLGQRYRRVLEASGSAAGVREAVSRIEPGGRSVLVGLTGEETVALATDALVVNDLEVVGSLGSPNVWAETLSLLETGAVRPSALITHRYSLDEYESALQMAAGLAGDAVKVVVMPNGGRHD